MFILSLRLRVWLAILTAGSIILAASVNAATCCVWRITNVGHPFYLAGTIHALASSDYPLPKGYDEALHNSQRLVFEIRFDPKSIFQTSLR